MSVNSSRGTNDRNTDKGEVGGSSPPRPTINPQYLCGHSHFFRLPDPRSKSHLPTICQLSGRANTNRIVPFHARLSTPIAIRRLGRGSQGQNPFNLNDHSRNGTSSDCALPGQVDYFRACPSSCNNPGLKIAVTESRSTSRLHRTNPAVEAG